MSVVCQAVCHMTMTRALFCRDLLILQKLYLRFGDNVSQQMHVSYQTSTRPSCLYQSSPAAAVRGQELPLLELQVHYRLEEEEEVT